METAAVVGLLLFLVSEVLPFTPLKGNGIIQQLVTTGRKFFPLKSDTDTK